MAVIGPNGELSVIVTRLGYESVVYFDNHTQWLCRLHVLILFYYCLLFMAFKERRTHPYKQQILSTDDAEYTESTVTRTTHHHTYHTQVHVVPAHRPDTTCIKYT